jgi:hypothetical protein
MPIRQPRKVTPHLWTTLAAASATACLVTGAPVGAAGFTSKQTQAAFGLTLPMTPTLIAAEGGEGGESGAMAGVSPDIAYLTRLALVEGHIKAAVLLYAKGMTDDAVGLSGHPEAEMMDEVRETLGERGAVDFTPQLEAVGYLMADGAPQSDVDAAMSDLAAAIADAAQTANLSEKTQIDALVALMRAAAGEYAGSIEDGAVADPMAYHEAYGFIEVARSAAEHLKAADDPKVAEAAEKTLISLTKTAPAFGDITSTDLFAGDPSILYGVAAEIELAGLKVN